MSREFECAWESVRPVPRVAIDFGDGHRLERTLHGNIVTYLCTSAGEVFDLIPGLVDAGEYVRRLDQALRLERAAQWSALMPTDQRSSTSRGLDPGREIVLRWHEALVARARTGEVGADDPIPIFDGSKMRVEHRLDLALAPSMSEADTASLNADALYNRTHRYPLASQLLLESPFVRPTEITALVYRHVLGVDLEDPYLGLAPDVLGGELGRDGFGMDEDEPAPAVPGVRPGCAASAPSDGARSRAGPGGWRSSASGSGSAGG